MRRSPSLLANKKSCLLIIGAIFIISRILYWWRGVRFDSGSLDSWWIIDPTLLRDRPWQSLFYLRTQLPGLNVYIALIMHLFPRHSTAAFHATYVGLGLMLAICLFLLLDRLRVNRILAVFITVVAVMSPVTVLYENWLSYEYPLAVLFCISALFLHRYASSHDGFDGVVLFTALALIGLFRVIYHFLWFALIVAVLAYALPRFRRRTALCAAAPGALLLVIYLRTVILFGVWAPGSDTYGAINFAFLTSLSVPRDVLVSMSLKREISPILLHGFRFEDAALVDVVPIPPKTGIPILDERLKSTGINRINMDSLWMAEVGRQLRRDGFAILRSHPTATLRTIRRNIINYFLPADVGWPFGSESEHPNQLVLAPFLKRFNLIISGKPPRHNYAFISYVANLCVLWFGLWGSARWLKRVVRRRQVNPRDLTIAFAFGSIAYLSAVVIFYDFTDQNRILFELFPLFAVLLGMLLTLVMRRFRLSRLDSVAREAESL